jgi:hypothetical protein
VSWAIANSRGSIAPVVKVEGTLKEIEESVGNEGEHGNATKDEEGYKAAQSRPTLHPRVYVYQILNQSTCQGDKTFMHTPDIII